MNNNKGIIITLIAAVMWGFSGTCSQYIFNNFDADPAYLTAARLLISGTILILTGFISGKKEMKTILMNKSDRLQLLAFAVFGLMFNQFTYMKAIYYTNSGTATVLQYIGPVFVMIVSCFLKKKLPQKKEVLAILMVIAGTFIIATHGNIHSMVINPTGLFWGIVAAVALMLYTMIPESITVKYGAIPVTGYGMFAGGVVLSLLSGLWNAPIIHDTGCLYAFLVIIIFGTIIPFTMYIKGIGLCGPVKASLVSSIEPVSATVFMVIWLKESFAFMDFTGFACIMTTVFLLVNKEKSQN